MRLIDARTKELKVFYDASTRPSYAILSHRWVDGNEVTFEDMQRPHRQWMPAWPKITMCCQQALADGLDYVWVDTCCIDKNSSAELSEAINSMYMWYSQADRCYAYLNDVVCELYDQLHVSSWDQALMPADMVEKIIASMWFTRAWTLQELIAPAQVIFYDTMFRRLGSKADFALEIEQAFAIPAEVLTNPQRLWEYPSAVRMSWAARRRATRTEDIAYSLFGLFGVNLPLLYGEGTRSFLRLQEEIIGQIHDHSIFVWSQKQKRSAKRFSAHISGQLPLLASSPADFEDCRDVFLPEDIKDIRPYTMTNLGLQIELRIFPYDLNVYVGLLDCKSKSTGYPYGILVARQGDKANTWRRLCVNEVDIVEIRRTEQLKNFVWQKMYIIKDNPNTSNILRNLHQPGKSRSCLPFYGLHVHAPAFLADYAGARRPYALVAYYDWDMRFGISDRERDGEYFQPGYTADVDARLTPSSHIGLTMAIDQTLKLTGFRKLSRREIREREQKKLTTERPATNAAEVPSSGIALGVLAMPLMSTGTAGVIVFDHVVHGIRSIKVGFDFDFRPVLFIATHEAEVDPQIQTWTQQNRFVHLESFERLCNLRDSPGENDGRRFWMLGPDYLKDHKDLAICEDGSLLVDKGVYAFTSEATAEPEHWVFKPYESQHWHLAVGLEKREHEGLIYWEFTMNKRDDPVKLEFELI